MKLLKGLILSLLLGLVPLALVADVGFVPPDGAPVYWVFPGGRAAGITSFTDTGSTFPNTPPLFAARYGTPPVLPDGSGVRGSFPVDAETVLGVMCLTLSRASEDPSNPWGLHRGVASVLECHDWAATMESRGWSGSTLRRLYAPDSLPPTPTRPTRPTAPPPVDPPAPPVDPPAEPPTAPPSCCVTEPCPPQRECPSCPACPLCGPARITLPHGIAASLAGLDAWNVINAQGKDAFHWLELWAGWSGVPIPQDIGATLAGAQTWAVVPPAGGRRQRLKRVAAWVESLR